jgi:anti-anti-sigma factor
MQIESEILEPGVIKITLSGRLDVLGAQAIDLKFTTLTATQKAMVLVDLSDVSFLASLGMRTFLSSAKALANRGGKMILFNPQPNVSSVLESSGLSRLIPVYHVYDEAIAFLTGRAPD